MKNRKPIPVWAERPNAVLIHIRIGTPLDEVERLVIMRTLEAVGNDVVTAARLLGISEKTLRRKARALPEESSENADRPPA